MFGSQMDRFAIVRAATPVGALPKSMQGFPSDEYLSLISTVQVDLEHKSTAPLLSG